MKINQSMAILFWIAKAKKTADGKIPIYCRITVNGLRAEISTGKKIEAAKWATDPGIAKGSTAEAQSINKELNKIKADLQKFYDQLEAVHDWVTAEMLRNAYLGIGPEKKSLMDAFTVHNQVLLERARADEPTLKEKTWQRFEITKGKVKEFLLHEYRLSDKLLTDVKRSFGEEFKHYLTTTGKLKLNTAMKYLKNTKQVFEFSVNREWITYNPMSGFKCTYRQPKRTRLTWEEILRIYQHPMPVKRLEEVRDVYIFSCFTGYAYQDVYLLEPDNVVRWLDNKHWLIKDRFKTEVKSNVPLMDIPLAIINKYRDHPYCVSHNKLLPVNCNQRYNGYLKEVAAICGIEKKLTTHTARHTFATTILIENDCPIESVSEMLGHNNIRTTQIYAQVTDVKVNNNMKAVQSRIMQKLKEPAKASGASAVIK